MLLEKAIEILELNIKEAGKKMPSDTLEALKLSVEAMKRVREESITGKFLSGKPLRGETL